MKKKNPNEVFEIVTKLKIEPNPITVEELSHALLEDDELKACYQDVYIIKIGNRRFSLGQTLAKLLLEKIDVKYIADKSVQIEPSQTFTFSKARKFIMHRFGITNLNYVGTKNKITGLLFSSKISDRYDHRNKFVAIYKAFKKNFPKHHLKPGTCLTTTECSSDEMKFLNELEREA